MSGLFDIVGPATSGSAVAAAIYAGAVALNKDATPAAKQDISRFIRRFSDTFDVSLVTRHLPQLFDRIYGKKHLSLRCAVRSAVTTVFFFFVALTVCFSERSDLIYSFVNTIEVPFPFDISIHPWGKWGFLLLLAFATTCMFALVPDYLALWKSRLLLHWSCQTQRGWIPLLLCPIDALLSLTLIIMTIGLVTALGMAGPQTYENFVDFLRSIIRGYGLLIGISGTANKPDDILSPIFITSTFLTSFWSLSVILSAIFTRFLATLRYPLGVLTWLLGADENGIKIVGMMLAALIWAAFIIYGFI
jgi:hypothetical protein